MIALTARFDRNGVVTKSACKRQMQPFWNLGKLRIPAEERHHKRVHEADSSIEHAFVDESISYSCIDVQHNSGVMA